ncbi:retrovirus polyprotein [Purpureocillium lavendulum]|uniref:ATP-dependent DNA helicase n=1 Tax=Purpureocillium lavendulum TaxID=1247861 RepID=A0AB34FC02_9HYPO|nr:retrovirus polyprotein [Purpureocillium lavendulum]
MSREELIVLRRTLTELLDKGFIRASSSPASAPVLFVRKPGGGLRFCVDYRGLNAITKKDRYPLPLIEETLRSLSKAKWLTKLDVIAAFHKVRVAEGDEWKTAFRTRYGLYEWLVTPFGLTGAPATFQRYINHTLREFLDEFCSAYIDDILIYSSGSLADHRKKVKQVLARLRDAGLQIDIDNDLGFIVEAGKGIRVDPEKVRAIQEWETPRSARAVRSFLGFANYYRQFIPKFSNIASPLTALTKKDAAFAWSNECQAAFDELKARLISAPVLAQWDPDRETIVETDSSGYVTGGALSQKGDDGLMRPELLAIIRCLEHWDAELRSVKSFAVLTDHLNLRYFTKKQPLSERQARWAETLSRYNFTIVHRPGKDATVPDALSRREQDMPHSAEDERLRGRRLQLLQPTKGGGLVTIVKSGYVSKGDADQPGDATAEQDESVENPFTEPEVQELWKEGLKQHNRYWLIRKAVQEGERRLPSQWGLPVMLSECSIDAGQRLCWRERIWVPNYEPLRTRLMQETHDSALAGHPGRDMLKSLLARRFYWPGLDTDARQFVRNCDVCGRSNVWREKRRGLLKPLPIPERIWSELSIDFVTDLPLTKSNGSTNLMVLTDRLSKTVVLESLKDITAETTARALMRNVLQHHGIPTAVVTDRWTQFTSRMWNRLCELLRIKQRLSTAWHPETDGATERANQKVERYIRIFTTYAQDDWDELLPAAAMALNNRTATSTGLSPFFFTHGYHLEPVQVKEALRPDGKSPVAKAEGIATACGLDSHRAANKPPRPFSEAKKWVWRHKLVLVIDEVSMLGGATLHEVSRHLQALRDCPDKPFGGIPVVLLMEDFYQFAPVRETSLLINRTLTDQTHAPLRQATISHHSGCSLWHLFKTVVLLEDQVRARNDPQLRALLGRVRSGVQTQQDLDLLNANIVGRSEIAFHNGLRAITPLNRTRWALNMEAVVVPGIFFYARGIPVVVNRNIYTGLKVVNVPRDENLSDTIAPRRDYTDPTNVAYARLDELSGQLFAGKGKTFAEVLLELRGNRVTNGEPSKCDFTSLYVPLSRCTTLQGIKLLSPVRLQDFIGNTLDHPMLDGMRTLKSLAAVKPSRRSFLIPKQVQDVIAEHPYAFKMLRQKWSSVFARDHNSSNVRLPLWRCKSRIGFDIEIRGNLIVEVFAIDGLGPDPVERFVNGQARMDWQEKDVLVIDEVSMLGARTLHAVNEQLCRLRGSQRDFGGTPIVLFCGDFHQFRTVQVSHTWQERSILLPSAAITWDVDNSFKAEQRHQHDKAHALWSRFTTVVMLNEQMRAAGDPDLQRLLTRIRRGEQDHTDLDFLNARCYREDRRIPWETGITVVTPLNRNRGNLNMEASLAFQAQQWSAMRIFVSEHKWKDGVPTEEEAIMVLNQGDDSAIPVPAVFMFVPGMPVVVNQNTYQGLKELKDVVAYNPVTNGGGYTALDVVVNKAFPGHRVSAGITIHFGPPAGIILASETTKDLHFVGMPPGTVLLTPMSVKIARQRKRPWQRTDGRSLDRVALELRGTRTTNIEGRAVPAQCDPYSLYVQLSRCRTLDGIMLASKVRERDLVGNRVPHEMTAAQSRLEELSERTVREALCWLAESS